jgi:hypothetical protein
MKFLRYLSHILLILTFTIISQTGGIILLLVIIATHKIKKQRFLKRTATFVGVYLLFNLLITPIIAKQFGREKIKTNATIQSRMLLTDLLNRNYVKAELNQVLEKTTTEFNAKYPKIKILYLDANFPFMDNFPLLPHLSHDDGKKLDLCFIYETFDGKITNNKPSRTGYGIFAMPTSKESDTNERCQKKGYWQYDFTKYVTFGIKNKDVRLATKPTRDLVLSLIKNSKIKKIFIEPHLKYRLKLNYEKMRFHGCQAVRHDDHIHIQL